MLGQMHYTLAHTNSHVEIKYFCPYLDGNPIVDIELLARANTDQLKILFLEEKPKDVVIGDSLSWILNCPLQNLSSLCINYLI